MQPEDLICNRDILSSVNWLQLMSKQMALAYKSASADDSVTWVLLLTARSACAIDVYLYIYMNIIAPQNPQSVNVVDFLNFLSPDAIDWKGRQTAAWSCSAATYKPDLHTQRGAVHPQAALSWCYLSSVIVCEVLFAQLNIIGSDPITAGVMS